MNNLPPAAAQLVPFIVTLLWLCGKAWLPRPIVLEAVSVATYIKCAAGHWQSARRIDSWWLWGWRFESRRLWKFVESHGTSARISLKVIFSPFSASPQGNFSHLPIRWRVAHPSPDPPKTKAPHLGGPSTLPLAATYSATHPRPH